MEILKKDIELNNTVVILGFFDGIHIGHKNVIEDAVSYAKKNNSTIVLLTFEDSPAKYFNNHVEYIIERKDSYKIISELGVNYIIEKDFSQIVDINAQDYLESIIENYRPIAVFTGFNHTFGSGRHGNPEMLKNSQSKYNYKYFCIPAVNYDDKIVSSTYIKNLLKSGKIENADKLLVNDFFIRSKVINGMKLARELGYPTANMIYPESIVRIPYGVYMAKVFGKKAVLNWGIKPTINGNEEVLEVHILDFNEDLYGKILEVSIIKKIRDEKKFGSLEELKLQIEKDVELCSELS